MPDTANPFSPPPLPAEVPREIVADPEAVVTSVRRPLVSLMLWSVVCVISAAPSFYFGYGTVAREQAAAMGLGVAIFIGTYTLADQWSVRHRWRRSRNVALTLRIGYATRVLISIFFPIGMFVDVLCGMMSVGMIEAGLPFLLSENGEARSGVPNAGFGGTLLITLVQGVLLNIVLFGYMSVVLCVIQLFRPRTND